MFRLAVTIFDYLKDIFVTKSGNLSLDDYSPYLVNKWLSFINPQVSEATNQINSKCYLENKELHYKITLNLFPKLKYVPKIEYIKKIKETVNETEDKQKVIQAVAFNMELSEKEASFLITELNCL